MTDDELRHVIRATIRECLAELVGDRVSPTYRLRKREAAEYLGIGVRTLEDLLYAGKIPATREGKLVFFKRADLEKYADNAPAWEPMDRIGLL